MVSTVLVANRGEIACRILRACTEAGLDSIAIYAENDSKSMFVELATKSIPLKGETISETYLDQKQIIDIALKHGADMIHPGFGFLSESSSIFNIFAACITFVLISSLGLFSIFKPKDIFS